MAAVYVAAIVACWAVARLGVQPAAILVSGAATLVVAAAFAAWPAEGLGVFLLFSLLAITWQYLLKADLRYFDEIGLLMLAAVAAVRHRIPNGRLRAGWAEIAVAVLVAMGVLSSLANNVPLAIWVPALLLLTKGIAFFYLVSWLRLGLEDVQRVGAVVLGAAFVLLFLGLVEFLDPAAFQHAMGLPEYHESRGGLVVIKSLFLHPGVLGWLTVYASLFLYVRFVLVGGWWRLPLALLFDVGAFLSGRRTPILGLVLALAVGVIWYWSRRPTAGSVARSWFPVAAAVLLLLAAFLPSVSGFYNDTLGQYANSPQAIGEIFSEHPDPKVISQVAPRTALYAASVAVARDHLPLGAGLGRFGSFMSRENYSPVYYRYGLNRIFGLRPEGRTAIDDTFWPSVLGETGPIGLLACMAFIGTLFARLWRATQAPGSLAFLAIVVGAMLALVQAVVASLTAPTFVASPIAYFVFATVGVVMAVAATAARDATSPRTATEAAVAPTAAP